MNPSEIRNSIFSTKDEAIEMSPFGTNHFHEIVLKDPRFPKSLGGDAGKKVFSKKDLIAYFELVAATGFQGGDAC